ncbi:MAG: serine/threonine protein kinase [Acidobacteria bacterium]|nr:serine/threonine protein kinase [Acidobacteriota bacterium]
MTAERWRQVREVLYAAAEQDAAARAEFLREACDGDAGLREEVERLLAALDESGAFLEPAAPAERDLSGGKIGPYLVLERAGQGGMGTVYRAVREDDYRQEVAIKLVKREVETEALTARFRRERQALARLNHPNIARLLDGGTTADGRPYLVMEWVEGTSITEYANARKLGVRERLGLFLTVCDAVAHAHRNLVVHRDLKPSNLPITAAGAPKLLDFGIAKILAPEAGEEEAMTVAGGLALTPDYASPEQVRGEPLTTATDIYSLGATLYELLTGVRPHRFETRTPPEIERVVCEREAALPSAVARAPGVGASALRGDLDNIVRKAMEKDQGRRYSHVDEFAADVRRYLEGLPVLARPWAVGYRARKFVARNKALAGAAAAVVVALAAGLGLTLWEAGVARHQREAAERRFELARRVADSLLYEINDRIQDLAGSTAARELVLRRSLEYLDALARESGSNAALQRDVANAYVRAAMLQGAPGVSNLGNPAAARESLGKARSLLESALAAAPGSAEIRRDLARAYRESAQLGRDGAEFERHAQAALAIVEELRRERPGDAGVLGDLERSEFTMARSMAAQARYGEAAAYYRRALAHAGAADAQNVALDQKSLGAVLFKMGELEDALKEYAAATATDEARVKAEAANGRAKLDLSYDYADTGLILLRLKRVDEGVAMYRRARELRVQMKAADPRDARAASALVSAEWRLGWALGVAGDRARAGEAFRRAVKGAEEMIARLPDRTVGMRALAEASWNIGESYRQQRGSCAQAVLWLERARGLYRELKVPAPRVEESLAACGGK